MMSALNSLTQWNAQMIGITEFYAKVFFPNLAPFFNQGSWADRMVNGIFANLQNETRF